MSASAVGGHVPSSPPVTDTRVEEPIRETIELPSPDVSPTLRFSKPVPSKYALHPPSDAQSVGEESDEEELVIEDSVEEDSSDADSSDSEEHSSEDDSSESEEESSEGDLSEGDELPSWINRSPSIELSLSPKARQPPPHEPSISPKTEPSSSSSFIKNSSDPATMVPPSDSSSMEPSSSSDPPPFIENTSDPAAMVSASNSSSMEPSSPSPFNYAEHEVLRDEDDVKIYSICLEKYLDEMDDDHEALTETWLAKARIYQRPTLFPRDRNKTRNRAANKPRSDPFANIKHSKNARTITLTGKAFSQLRPKGETITSSARISSTKAVSIEVPNYTHYTRISGNVLGTNTRQLQVWPYFGEDVDDDGTIRERFDVIVEDRPRKVLISQQVSTYSPYFEAFLEEIDCPMDTILKYLLEASEGPDGLLSRLTSFADDAKFARTMIRAKDKFCRDDFDRTSQRWVSVASSLPEIDDETLWKAAVVCHTFWIRTNFSPWQIARKFAKFPDNNKIEGLVTYELARNYASVACSICQLHDCPFHGTILERPDAKDLSDEEDDANSVDALDVDYPPRVNFKELATAPLEREPTGRTSPAQPKKPLNWWMNEANNPVNRYDDEYLDRRCRNVAIQRGVPKRTLLGRSLVHGFGLYAGEPIAKGEFVGEYQGEIITRDETERRGAIYDFQKLSYIFDLNRDQTIDSQRMGNKIRFINHAANSNLRNLRPKIMLCNLAHRIGMFAHRDIKVGEELFFDYGNSYHEKLYGEEEQAQKAKNKGKGKAAVSHIRPSRKSYQPQPEVVVALPPRKESKDIFEVESDSEESEDERPTKRRRRSRIPSPKRSRPSPPKQQSTETSAKSAARKTEDRSRARRSNTASTVGSQASTVGSKAPSLKAAIKSAPRPKTLSRRPRVVVDESEDDSDDDSDEESEDEMEVPRRSSRPRMEGIRVILRNDIDLSRPPPYGPPPSRPNDKLPVNNPYDPNDDPECQKTHTSTKNKDPTAAATPTAPPSPPAAATTGKTTTATATKPSSGAVLSSSVENTTSPRSADCQKARWPGHKIFCNTHKADTDCERTKKTAPTTNTKNLSKTVEKPFHKLQARTWLHDRPDSDVYKLLIDCFRLRQEDEYSFKGDVDYDSIYAGGPHSKAPFLRFLNQAEAAKDVLPPWWSSKNTKACVAFGMERGSEDWSSLACCIEKHDIQDHYGSQDMPMQLRMLADQIYGSNPTGQSGSGMLDLKLMMEGATGGPYEQYKGGSVTNLGL
ncbi:SET domain-containing protein, partial [Aureobasidium melanogenum]